MTAVWMRVRSDLRSTWRASVLIVLLIGLAGGVAMTAAAGARRTDTAFPRFLQATDASDFLVSAAGNGAPLYSKVAALPEVQTAGIGEGMPLFFEPAPGHTAPMVQGFASTGAVGYSVEKLHMLAGRAPNPNRPFEAAPTLTMAERYHLHVGDHVTMLRVDSNSGRPVLGPDGKPLQYRFLITGIELTFDEIIPIAANDGLPQLFLTPALVRELAIPERQLAYDGVLVRLRPGASAAAFRRGVQAIAANGPGGRPLVQGLFVADERDHHARVEEAIRPEAVALGIFALLAAVAGLLAIGQILSRRIFLDAADYPTLRSLGMDAGQLLAVSVIRGALLAAAGAVVAVVAAFLASPLMPIGPARLAEPHRGFEANLSVLGAGFAAIVLLVSGIAALSGWRAARTAQRSVGTLELRSARHPSRIASSIRQAGVAPSVTNGVRFALEPGRGRTAVPVRTAILGIVVAIAAMTAAFTFGTNLTRLVSTPSLYGRTWDLDIDSGFGVVPRQKIDGLLASNRSVAAYTGGMYAELSIDGHQVPAVSLDPLKGDVFPTLVRGRDPRTAGEIDLGAKTMRALGVGIGDRVSVATNGHTARMRVVGESVFPSMGQGSFNPTGLGEGAVLTGRFVAPVWMPPGTYTFVLVRFAGGVDPRAAIHHIVTDLPGSGVCPPDQECGLRTSLLPAELTTYNDITTVPLILALLLILMGIAVTAHTLVTSVRRRRRDLATLKTLGFVRRQVLVTVASQASVFAAIGLVLGIPLGIAAGRWAWTLFADQLGVSPAPVVPFVIVGLAVPATLLLANVVAALPGRSAARTQPAAVLRAE